MGRQGEEELAFNHVLIREEVSLMDVCEVVDMTVLFFSAPEGHLSFFRTTTAALKPLCIPMTPENKGRFPSLNYCRG